MNDDKENFDKIGQALRDYRKARMRDQVSIKVLQEILTEYYQEKHGDENPGDYSPIPKYI